MKKKYIVCLTEAERAQLHELITKGKSAAYKIKHAYILLKADEEGPAWKDYQIMEAFSVSENTVYGVRKRFIEQGLEAALNRRKQEKPSHKPTFDGQGEARLIALSCSEPPSGHSRWTLRLLADKVVELEIVEKASYETVRQTLKKRAQAAPAHVVGNPTGAQWGVCGVYGGCTGFVLSAI